MAVLGLPYRVVYEARGFRSGLNDVVAAVCKPDMNVVGTFALAEMPGVFKGRYYFDYITQTSDPTGEYMVAIASPTEGIQTTIRLGLYSDNAINIQPAAEAIRRSADLITATVL